MKNLAEGAAEHIYIQFKNIRIANTFILIK